MRNTIYTCKYARSRVTTIALLLSVAGTIQAQTVDFDGYKYDAGNINNLNIEGSSQSLELSYPISDIKEVTFSYESVDFSKADKKTSGNEIKSFSFKVSGNNGAIVTDVAGKINGDEISVFIPYYEGGSIKASFESTGKVFAGGNVQKSGVTGNVYNEDVEYKVVDADGNIHTYTVKVYNSGLPIIRIDGPADMASKMWNGGYPLTMTSADGKTLATVTSEIKPKGGQNSASKRDFNVKCSKKTAFGNMTKNKRWVLLSNADDASMLRNQAGLTLGKELEGMAWTPSSQFVEVVMGDKHLGTYLLCEQIRCADGRVKESAVWEITNDIEADDVWFESDNGTKIRLEDSAEDDASADLAKAKEAVNKFEAALYGNKSFGSYIDESSFVDWIWANEICKNEKSFKKNCYFRITTDGKIAMSPIFSNEKWLGNNGQSYEGFSTINSGWCEKMMRDVDFSAAVSSRFKEIASTESSVCSAIEDGKELISLSAEANAKLWGSSNLSNEASSLTSWIKKRYAWLSSVNDVISRCAKADKATSNNEIKSFEIKKSSNGKALLEDYTATIANDSVKIFVPYLVNFTLQADFSVANGAKVYCNGDEIQSGKSSVDYLKPQQFKVVASNGDVHTYTVCIYNSGLPVIYLTTQNNQAINSKDVWLDNTQFTVYKADGTVDYDAAPDMAQVKGRGNSTWSASTEKRPYAVKLNKKSRILGMQEHKRWVLMANFYDATFFRNTMSNYLGKKFTNQQWVPSGYNCELVLNGSHKGNYYFCEQAKINDNRVDGEFLIEADIKEGIHNGAIEGPKSHNAFFTKDPELETSSSDYQKVKGIIEKFENALYSGDYNSLEKLIDLESFVDWYMIKEWSHDIDGNMHTSCYFTIMDDGKIKMGPMWDFDIAWGGNPFASMGQGYNAYEGYYITTNPITQPQGKTCTSWFGEFIKMPAFKQLLKEKVLDANSHLDEILAYIDENTEYLLLSATANKVGNGSGGGFGGFGGFGGWGGGFGGGGNASSATTPESYRKSMSDLKNYVKTRMEWFVGEVKGF